MNKNNTRMEIAVYPLGTGSTNITQEIASLIQVIEQSGFPYEVTVMGTTVEGKSDELFALAHKLHDAVFSDSVKRAVTVIKIDERRHE